MLIDNILMNDNAQPQTILQTRETIAFSWWTTLPLYSPDVAPSDNNLFDQMKEGLRGKHYDSDEEEKNAVIKWLKKQSTEFYKARIYALIQRWNNAIERNGDSVEKSGYDLQRKSLILMYKRHFDVERHDSSVYTFTFLYQQLFMS